MTLEPPAPPCQSVCSPGNVGCETAGLPCLAHLHVSDLTADHQLHHDTHNGQRPTVNGPVRFHRLHLQRTLVQPLEQAPLKSDVLSASCPDVMSDGLTLDTAATSARVCNLEFGLECHR